MGEIQDYFYVTISDDQMSAKIHCTDVYKSEDIEKLQLDQTLIIQFLQENNVHYGIDDKTIEFIVSNLLLNKFPLTVARGTPVEHGKNAEITYEANFSSEIVRNNDWNFRDVMRIPSVKRGQKLATNTLPTKGTDGTNVSGDILRARPGKPAVLKAGKNVVYRESDLAYYATTEGQVSFTKHLINVQKVYEVSESLSMKTGNLDFVGSIVIKGDVPTGYTVRADGDIKIFGIVEAASVTAGGSIYISEGLAGLKNGTIQASENIHIGYINQGIAHAGKDLYVENSILHSTCTAKNSVYCQRGNIIGGSLSAGKFIEAKDVGNRLNTKTAINLAINEKVYDKEKDLQSKKRELEGTLEKLLKLGKKLEDEKDQLNAKLRVTLLRQKNSQRKVIEKINKIDEELFQMKTNLGCEKEARLIVRNSLYPNVVIAFGKYKRQINKTHQYIQMELDRNEIIFQSL